MTNRSPVSYEFGPFHLNASERLLLRDGQPVPLPPKVFETLLTLIENSGRLLEKDALMTRLWPDTFVEEATLARNISDLRKVRSHFPEWNITYDLDKIILEIIDRRLRAGGAHSE